MVLASQEFDKTPAARIPFTLGEAKAPDGPIEIVVSAVDSSYRSLGKGNAGEPVFPLTLATKNPHIAVLSGQHTLNAAARRLLYTGRGRVAHGVRVGPHFFPATTAGGNNACLFLFR